MASKNRLREVRVEEAITISELSRAADVSDTVIRKVETRKISGKPETRRKILKGLSKLAEKDVDYDYIFPHG